MKNSILVILTALFSLQTHAQDPELFEHTWYLQKVIIDGEDYQVADLSDEPFFSSITNELNFYDDEPTDYIDIFFCNNWFSNFYLDTDTEELILSDFEPSPITECEFQSNPDIEPIATYEELYISIFQYQDEEFNYIPKNPFTYTLETEDDIQFLTIENTNGDYAVYNNQELSVSSFETIAFSAYPNPTNEVLHITNSGQAQKASIYSITGQKVAEHTDSFNEINVRHLQNGVYFLVLESPEGEKQTHRFIKE